MPVLHSCLRNFCSACINAWPMETLTRDLRPTPADIACVHAGLQESLEPYEDDVVSLGLAFDPSLGFLFGKIAPKYMGTGTKRARRAELSHLIPAMCAAPLVAVTCIRANDAGCSMLRHNCTEQGRQLCFARHAGCAADRNLVSA